ncbi:hypothetical protein BN938_2730 [Mucinivorans hirudinis]|uniref:Glycosyltransferase n=1 Tax=Mucinivorans hirudinis TaxID=1433126 RepID=A0A060REL9_9BACT|nr:hypothetical protein BN938_2730 [Mucinivorans hirudinis]
MFVDADDFLSENSINEDVINNLLDSDIDIAYFEATMITHRIAEDRRHIRNFGNKFSELNLDEATMYFHTPTIRFRRHQQRSLYGRESG